MNEIRHSVIRDLISEIIYDDSDKDFVSLYKKLTITEKEYLHTIILDNKVAPRFIKYINNKDISDFICKNFYEKCKAQTKRYQIQSLQVINEIREINRLFAKEGLKFIYLKGAAIQKNYEDVSLRPMADIDILFKKEDLLKAYEILHKNNFLSLNQKQYLNKTNIDDFCRRCHHIDVITKNNISIELHHRVTRPQDFKNCPISKSFFEDFISIDHFNEKINIPSIENIVIHSLCHFSINSSFKKMLRTLIDIKNLSFNYNIKWEDIILKYDNVKIRKNICLSIELINLNQGNIQDLDRNRVMLKKYFPTKEIIQLAQQALYDVSNLNPAEDFLNRFRGVKYLKTVPRLLFPSRNMLKYRYKISNPGFSSYAKYYNEQLTKTLLLLKKLKKGKNYLGNNNDLYNWQDQDI